MFIFDDDSQISKNVFFNNQEKDIQEYLVQSNYDKAIISSTKEIPSFYKKASFIELNNKTPLPINLAYDTPKTLGSDRIALSVGASILFPNKNCLIIGTGTCITLDFLAKTGEYLGGAISPGLTMRLQSLNIFTDKLPLVKLKKNKKEFPLIGKTTEESIESGVLNGTFAEIEGTIAKYKENYKDLTVILTGGDLKLFEKNLKSNIFVFSNLQAIGLNRILNYNAET